jgi:hypothetical protein
MPPRPMLRRSSSFLWRVSTFLNLFLRLAVPNRLPPPASLLPACSLHSFDLLLIHSFWSWPLPLVFSAFLLSVPLSWPSRRPPASDDTLSPVCGHPWRVSCCHSLRPFLNTRHITPVSLLLQHFQVNDAQTPPPTGTTPPAIASPHRRRATSAATNCISRPLPCSILVAVHAYMFRGPA